MGWGSQTIVNYEVAEIASKTKGIEIEVIDLNTLVPLDTVTIASSLKKTGRCIISHEAPIRSGYGAEIASILQEMAIYNLKAPIMRCCGFDTPFPYAHESLYLPGHGRLLSTINKILSY